MKFNWGTALVIFFVIYIGMLVRIVIKSKSVDHSLVVENYYQHDIEYQEKVDKINNRLLLEQDLTIDYLDGKQKLALDFGENSNKIVKADVHLYRASDQSQDYEKSIKVTSHQINIDLPKLRTGKWKVKVTWEDSARTYLKEKEIYINKA